MNTLSGLIKEISSWNRIAGDRDFFEGQRFKIPDHSFRTKSRWMLAGTNKIVCAEKPKACSCFDAKFDLGLILDRMMNRFETFPIESVQKTDLKILLFQKEISILTTHIKAKVSKYKEHVNCTRYVVRTLKSLCTSNQGRVETRSKWLLKAIEKVQKEFPPTKIQRTPILKSISWHYSNPSNELFQFMKNSIAAATKKIFCMMYSISNKVIMDMLEEKQKQGISVKLYIDENAFKDAKSPISDTITVVKVPTQGLMHVKIVVIDSKKVIFGSCNLTTQGMTRDQNLMTEITSKAFAKHVKTYAKYLVSKDQNQEKYSDISFLLSNREKLQFSFVQQRATEKERIVQLLNSAQKTIRIAMFTFTDKIFINACVDAKKRGVVVEVLVDANQSQMKNTGLLTVETLKKHKITVFTSKTNSVMHHKFCIIDNSFFIYGSTNWTNKAFNANEECLAVLSSLSPQNYQVVSKIWQSLMYNASCG